MIEVQDIMFYFRNDEKKTTRIEKYIKLKDPKFYMTGFKRNRNDTLFEDISDEEEKTENILDVYEMNRYIIGDILTRDMSMEEMSDFNKCKDASFVSNVEKFKNFMKFDFRIHEKAIELFAYLAYEYVGLLTQVGLIVKKDMEFKCNDLQFLRIGTTFGIVTEEMKKRLINIESFDDDQFIQPQTTSKKPLQPVHIFEAARRLYSNKF
jgi:uncharacterized Fe-S cluster-containing protein